MKTTSIALTIAALTFSATCFAASPDISNAGSVTVTGKSEVKRSQITPGQFDEIGGKYIWKMARHSL